MGILGGRLSVQDQGDEAVIGRPAALRLLACIPWSRVPQLWRWVRACRPKAASFYLQGG